MSYCHNTYWLNNPPEPEDRTKSPDFGCVSESESLGNVYADYVSKIHLEHLEEKYAPHIGEDAFWVAVRDALEETEDLDRNTFCTQDNWSAIEALLIDRHNEELPEVSNG